MLSNRQLEHKGTIKASEINHLLPHFKLLKSEMANLVNLVSLANCEQKIDTRIFHLQQYLVSTAVFQFLNTLVSCLTCLKLFTGRCDLFFSCEETLSVLTTNLSMRMFVSHSTKTTISCKRLLSCFRVDTYIENIEGSNDIFREYINDCDWSIYRKGLFILCQ